MQPTDPPHPGRDTAAPPSDGCRIVTVNGGSSSIKFAVFAAGEPPTRLTAGQIDRIGSPDASLTVKDGRVETIDRRPLPDAADHGRAAEHLADFLLGRGDVRAIAGIGH